MLASLGYLAGCGGMAYARVWPNGLVQSLFFAGGAIVAVYTRQDWRPRVPRLVLFTGGWMMWILSSAICGIVKSEGTSGSRLVAGYLLVLGGILLIFASVYGTKRRVPAPVLYLGKISYGLYVFHVLMLQLSLRWTTRTKLSLLASHLAGAELALAATVAAAMLSYRYLESPFLHLKDRWTLVTSRPV